MSASRSPSPQPDHVSLIQRDPDWGLAVWSVSAAGVERAKSRSAELATSELILRVYCFDRRQGARARARHRDYRLTEWLGHRLVLLGTPGRAHQAAVGFRDRNSAFVPVCRSSLVTSPTARPLPAAPLEDAPTADKTPGEGA